MDAPPIQFPRQMKRGPKVRSGPCAAVLQLPTAADLYARFMSCKYNPEDREAAYAEHFEWGERLQLTHNSVRELIANKIARLERELGELALLQQDR